MLVKESNLFGKLSEEEIVDFEKENQLTIPEGYRNFLLQTNGGVPIKQLNNSPNTVVTYLLGMHNGDFYASLYKHIDLFKTRIPFSTLPIGNDCFGNLFLMSFHRENLGQIFFWDHENESKDQDGHYTENISFIASSFEEFLESLT